MKTKLAALATIAAITCSTITAPTTLAETTGTEVTPISKEQRGETTEKEALNTTEIALVVSGVVTAIAAVAGGLVWAVSQGFLPNPLPGLIPSPSKPQKAQTSQAPKTTPTPKPSPTRAPQPAPAPRATSKPAPQPAPVATSYRNCKAVWNAIGRPIRSTDPGYHSRLDRDGDGVGCEKDPR